ncbi:MAG: Flp pilus assembly complex ATPase component TadA [Opitutaceae bacterium]|jgi:general secretion pathway protein E/type IV pilus assembly protein PilB|nr:Flp pilus assembly complex ATPase component TadA [Opitutaceae bacterium]
MNLIEQEAAVLLRRGIIDQRKLDLARRRSQLQQIPLHRSVVDLGFATERDAYDAAAEAHGLDFIDLAEVTAARELVAQVPVRIVLTHRLAPVSLQDGLLVAAFAEPPTSTDLGKLRLLLGLRIRAVLCGPAAMRDYVKRHYGLGADTIQMLSQQQGAADPADQIVFDVQDKDADASADPSIIHFVDQILSEALRLEATDIHLEPFGNAVKLRYRIDGLLQDIPIPEGLRPHYLALVSRLKVMADLNITERRIAHDGRIAMRRGDRQYDLRVSIIPTTHGESICLRVLSRDNLLVENLSRLGMEPEQGAVLENLSRLPQGLALLTGPTGSGKTTTLYALLSAARDGLRKIITIENPVEYTLDGVSQIQTREELGLDFAAGLRSVLRHDPDIILIGEIRDKETADVAMHSAQTGHLVFSTLHTNDSVSALTRLVDMGVEPWVIGASLACSIAQRLARRVCPHCSRPDEATIDPATRAEMAASLGIAPEAVRAWRGAGCPECRGTGERGRVAIYEIFIMTDEVVDLLSTASLKTVALRDLARKQGWKPLREQGWRKVQQGVISIAENHRLTRRLQLGTTA